MPMPLRQPSKAVSFNREVVSGQILNSPASADQPIPESKGIPDAE
jgi:hypothetical protein